MNHRFSLRIITLSLLSAFVAYYMVTIGAKAFQPRVVNLDFVAFYCAGVVVNHGFDPYLTEPLRSCEHVVGPSFRHGSVLVLPAPLPSYDFGIFRFLALLPFKIAAVLWSILLLVVVTADILLARRLTRLPLWMPVLLLGVSLGWTSIFLGQIMPICVLGLLLLAYGVETDNVYAAIVGAMFSAIEPHIALVGIATTFLIGNARIRIGVSIGVFALTVLSIVLLPISEIIEYVRVVLPAHGLSEINNREQFSLSHQLHLIGFSESLALHMSEIAFFAVFVVSLFRARDIFVKAGALAAIGFTSTVVLLVEPFLHITQMPIAGICALAWYASTRSRFAAIAMLCLCVPWLNYAPVVVAGPLVCLSIFAFARLAGASVLIASISSLAGILCVYAPGVLVSDEPRHLLLSSTVRPTDLAEVSWRQAIDLSGQTIAWVFVFLQIPTYVGVVLTAVGTYKAKRMVAP